MCGLTLCIAFQRHEGDRDGRISSDSHDGPSTPTSQSDILHRLRDSLHAENDARGPDTSGIYATFIPTPLGKLHLSLGSAVLGLRGDLTAQPLVGSRGVLAWNGQVFSGTHEAEESGDAGDEDELDAELDIPVDQNDTRRLFNLLEAGMDPEHVFAHVEGP